MKILRDQHQIVFENIGSKAPGIAAFIKWLNFNMEEGEIWEEDLVFDQIYAKDGDVYIDWDPESEYMEGDPETFPDRYLKILKRKGPKEFRLCSKNVAEEIASGDRDEDWPLERIINEGDEEAGITETPGANYEIGDEKLLWAQLISPVSESMDLDKAKSIIESAGLKLNRVDESLHINAVGIRGETPEKVKVLIKLGVDEYIRGLIKKVEQSPDSECVLVHFGTDGGNIGAEDVKRELKSAARSAGITLDFLKNSELINYDNVDWWRD